MGVVKKQGLQNTVISYAGGALGFLNKVFLLPKVFLLEQVGLVNVMMSFSLLYAQFSGFGIYSVVIRFYPQYKKEHRAAFLKLVLKWLFVGFFVLTALFFFFQNWIREGLFEKSALLQNYFFWILPLAFFILLLEVLDSYSKALLKTVAVSLIKDVVFRLLFFVLIILFYLDLLNFDLFVYLFVGAYGLLVVLMIGYLIKIQAFKLDNKGLKIYSLSPILAFGLYVFLADSSSLLVSSIDSLMLADQKGLSDTGIYTTMGFLVSAFLIPYRSMAKIATPIVPQLWKENRREEIQALYLRFSNSGFVLGAVFFLLIFLNFDLLFLFLPPEFETGLFVFVGIGLARLIEVMYGINGVILVNSSKYKTDLLFALLLILLTVVTNYLCIPRWGMKGAVVASFISITAINVTRGIYLKSVFGFYIFNKNLALQLFFFAACFLAAQVFDVKNIYLQLLINNSMLVLLFLIPIYHFNLAPEIKNSVVKTIKNKFKK